MPTPARSRLPGLTTQIFVGLAAGVAVGLVWPAVGVGARPLADAFLRMIKMIIGPLLFATLAGGIAGSGDLKAMGRIGLKAIVYFEAATTIALLIGLLLVNTFTPGAGLAVRIGADAQAASAMAAAQQRPWDIFLHMFPTSVVDALARGDILQIVVFSTLLGIDEIMDMGRTSVNVMGNCIATVVVARWEGVFDDAQMRAFAAGRTHKAA